MPRRKAFEKDCYYHCYNRGSHREDIFLDKSDFEFFMEIIEEQRKKYRQIKVLEFALLPNHFHFVFKNLAYGYYISRFFSRIEGQYARYFVLKYGILKGKKMFEGRFRSEFINTEEYLMNCRYYVALNPIKHGYVTKIKERKYVHFSDIVERELDNITISQKRRGSQELEGKLEY